MAAGALLIVLGVVFLAVALGFAWQENRARAEGVTIYSVEDSISFVYGRLGEAATANLRRVGVRRILEWEVRYLQDPAVRGDDVAIVAGGLPSAAFAQETLAGLGYVYDGPDIIEVLDLRAEYLRSIGAVGEALTAEEVADLDEPAD